MSIVKDIDIYSVRQVMFKRREVLKRFIKGIE